MSIANIVLNGENLNASLQRSEQARISTLAIPNQYCIGSPNQVHKAR